MQRKPEPELMDLPDEVQAYASADFREVNARYVDRLTELADPLGQALKAIDLGCGPGDIPLLAASRRSQWQITGVDGSAAMLDVARENAMRDHLDSQVRFHLADATRTELPAGSFDVVFSNSLLHHVSDAVAMWTEMARLGRSGAVLFLRDLLRPATEAAARDIVEQHAGTESSLLQEEFHRSLLAAYTVDEVRVQLDQLGLPTLRVEQSSDRHLDVYGMLNS